jgi:hypothetical protein
VHDVKIGLSLHQMNVPAMPSSSTSIRLLVLRVTAVPSAKVNFLWPPMAVA